jgi:hypothetical protein
MLLAQLLSHRIGTVLTIILNSAKVALNQITSLENSMSRRTPIQQWRAQFLSVACFPMIPVLRVMTRTFL